MKKFYFFVLAMVCSLAGMAQSSMKVTSLGSTPVTTPEDGKIYAIQCNSQADAGGYTTWMYDNGDTPKGDASLNLAVDELVSTKYFWNITPTGTAGVYAFQNYQTGSYISIDGTSSGGAVTMSSAEKTAIITLGTGDVADYISLKHMTSDQWIDMGYSGTGISTWGGGVAGSRRMQIYEVELEAVSSREELLASLKTTYTSYATDYPASDFTPGTSYGEYDATAVQAYIDALDYAGSVIDAEGGDLTDDEIKAAEQKVKDTYTAMAASRISYAMEVTPGYYVIKNALTFTTTETTPEGEDPETGEPTGGETITKYWTKGLYDNKGYACWKTFEEKADFLFKIEATSTPKAYKVTNMLNGLTFDPVSMSTNVTMSATDSLICFDWRYDNVKVITDTVDNTQSKLVTTVNIRLASQAERNYYYIHAGGHGGGAGVSGNIVGWSTDSGESVGATDWYLEPIDEATAEAWIEAASPVKQIRAVLDSIATIETNYPAEKTIAIDEIANINTDIQIASSGTFSSPWTESTEGTVDALFDDDLSTFWHSAWSSSTSGASVNTTPGTNYYVISDLANQISGGLAISVGRRSSGANDHPVKFTVYGTNDYDSSKDAGYGYDGLEWTELGELSVPYGSNTETVTSNAIAFDGTYSYYKFLCTETNPISYNRGYFHMSELRVYAATIGHGAETTQATTRAEQIATMDAALAAWDAKGYTETSVTDPNDADFVAAYKAVYDAYAAWKAVYADPAEMRTAAKKAESYASLIVEGSNPGQWPVGSGASVITAAVNAEKAYNNAGIYTAEEVAAQAKAINDAMDAVAGQANQVDPSKWYTIRFATEDEFEQWGWDKNTAVSTTYGDLYGMKMAPATSITEDGVTSYEQVTGEDVRNGDQIRFCSDEPDEGQFRFVEAGDGKYYLQHMSGWYVGTNGKLTNYPALFSTRAVGCGKSLIKVQNLKGEDITTATSPSYLHAQVDGHSLVAWSADAVDSRSALYIEEVAAPEVAAAQYETVLPGTMKFYTTPATISNVEGAQLYTFAGYENSAEGLKLAFDKATTAEAGKAYLMVVDGTYPEEATEEDKANAISYTLGSTFAVAPDSTQALVGTYAYQWVNAEDTVHTVTIFQNVMQMASGEDNTDCARDISAYTGAIDITKAAEIATEGKDLVITVGGYDPTAIKEVVAKALSTAAGKIYTVDGKYLGTGNIATASKYGKGVYIVNGVKVSIK